MELVVALNVDNSRHKSLPEPEDRDAIKAILGKLVVDRSIDV